METTQALRLLLPEQPVPQGCLHHVHAVSEVAADSLAWHGLLDEHLKVSMHRQLCKAAARRQCLQCHPFCKFQCA